MYISVRVNFNFATFRSFINLQKDEPKEFMYMLDLKAEDHRVIRRAAQTVVETEAY